MKREKIENALNEISDSFIREAAGAKTKPRLAPWFGVVAAVLAAALIAGALWQPGSALPKSTQHPSPTLTGTPTEGRNSTIHQAFYLSAPVYPDLCGYPLEFDSGTYAQWLADQEALHDQPEGYADNLHGCFSKMVPLLLAGNGGDNAVCSPLNIYMALAMLAESTDGASREQILQLLDADSLEALRRQAGQVWKANYNDDGLTTSVLASSLWLDSECTVNRQTADLLAEHYFASVFSGDLGSAEMNEALRSWLSEQTGGLLDGFIEDVKMDPRTVLALATTVFFQTQWCDPFQARNNTTDTFHGTAGDTTETFMNQTLSYGPYYWSEHFGAVQLELEGGCNMWLFLPDEGTSPEQLVQSGELFQFLQAKPNIRASDFGNKKHLIVNLSMPKFDIGTRQDLSDALKALGVTDIFDSEKADFTPILPEKDGGYVDQAEHAARVALDEEGVTAAAFTLIQRYGAGMPPEEEMDFVLDRPFAFVIESQDGLPLFAGIVNQP